MRRCRSPAALSLCLCLPLLLAGCAASTVPTAREAQMAPMARMALPASVAEVAEESFGKPAWERRGEFLLTGQTVTYERSAARLSLFEDLAAPTGWLSYTWAGPAGATRADCVGQPAASTTNSRLVSPRPWALHCTWTGASSAMLQIGEGQLREGRLSREGSYRRGELTLGLRSAHVLEGDATPHTTAVGYELLHEGVVVGSVELSRGVPRLRRPDPATPLGRAVTEAALVLALASEPG
ncbi:hypothetical protein [Roseateles sp.]|uniref:hypothetical protein n=1 Tax=Roseateles sp. TaxID=1971397 RepID=UPI003BAA7D02